MFINIKKPEGVGGMQRYQEEYIENLKKIRALNLRKSASGKSFEEYCAEMLRDRKSAELIIKRNMLILRERLFPILDNLFKADKNEFEELKTFSSELLSPGNESDVGLFCQIQRSMLSYARFNKERDAMIEGLYWLGIGYNSMCAKLIGLEYSVCEKYYSQMRLCFAEAAAYLKYFNELDSTETRGYILRSRANMSLGGFKSNVEKIRMVKRTLMIFQDPEYREKAPELPWDKYVYTIHRQMASSACYKKEIDLTPQDVADFMESVYIIYETRLREAKENNESTPIRPRFSCYVAEYYCGLYGFEELLSKIEELMDSADYNDHSEDTMYGIISLTAFYCQYLEESPEYLPKRLEYIGSLNKRALSYVKSFPEWELSEKLFFYLRQLSFTYIETEDGISYKDFIVKLEMSFAPAIYAHSCAVGRAASALCRIIIEEEPSYFDDIDFIKEINDIGEKKRVIIDYAFECGLLHDVGKMNFINLFSNAPRQWFEDENEMAQLHTLVGNVCLEKRKSTSHCAYIALGHHSWYDGSRGYPHEYKRLECEYRQMVDVIGLMDWLDNTTDNESRIFRGVDKTFEEAREEAIALEGKRFSPMLSARLREKEVSDIIKRALKDGRIEAYRNIYELDNENGKER